VYRPRTCPLWGGVRALVHRWHALRDSREVASLAPSAHPRAAGAPAAPPGVLSHPGPATAALRKPCPGCCACCVPLRGLARTGGPRVQGRCGAGLLPRAGPPKKGGPRACGMSQRCEERGEVGGQTPARKAVVARRYISVQARMTRGPRARCTAAGSTRTVTGTLTPLWPLDKPSHSSALVLEHGVWCLRALELVHHDHCCSCGTPPQNPKTPI